jgi:replication-associated recombination protein RarA
MLLLDFLCEKVDKLTGENQLPHLLLYGPPSTSKTLTILIIAPQALWILLPKHDFRTKCI